MWGRSFIEYCLYVRPVNQRRLVSVREDLIDDKVSLEEVEARIFGVPVRPAHSRCIHLYTATPEIAH